MNEFESNKTVKALLLSGLSAVLGLLAPNLLFIAPIRAQSVPPPNPPLGQWTHSRGDATSASASKAAQLNDTLLPAPVWTASPGNNEGDSIFFYENYALPVYTGQLGPRVFVGSRLGITAIDDNPGHLGYGQALWSADLIAGNDHVRGLACEVRATGSTLIYAATSNGQLHCIADTGSSFLSQWSTSPSATKYYSRGPLVAANSKILYVASTVPLTSTLDGQTGIAAFGKSDGQFKYFIPTGAVLGSDPYDDLTTEAPPSVNTSTSRIYFNAGASLKCFALGTGVELWAVPGYVLSTNACTIVDAANDRVLAIANAGTLDSIDGATGQVQWSFPMSAPVEWAAANGKVFFYSYPSGVVIALNASDGSFLWSTPMSGNNSKLFAANSGAHQEIWVCDFEFAATFTKLSQLDGHVMGSTTTSLPSARNCNANASLGADGIYTTRNHDRSSVVKFQ